MSLVVRSCPTIGPIGIVALAPDVLVDVVYSLFVVAIVIPRREMELMLYGDEDDEEDDDETLIMET